MSPFDGAGRIHKRAFLVSNLVLFALCMVSACARYYIRFCVQRQFSSDDGILLFGLACLVAAVSLLLTFVDEMYIVGAMEAGNLPHIPLPGNYIDQAFHFQKMVTVALVLTWCSIVSVKFSYLFLFKRLIGRMPRMTAFWWVAAIYNVMISIYGGVVYGVACPYYYSLKGLQCVHGKGLQRSIAFSQSQMVLDIVGDCLIIFIPCRLIWSVKVRWTQKAALGATLCLTILTILCTIIRIAGIHTGRTVESIDSVWETYWQFVAANIALTMTAATAFRNFFVSRNGENHRHAPNVPEANSKSTWYSQSQKLLRSLISFRFWATLRPKSYSRTSDDRVDSGRDDTPLRMRHHIPRATLTGMRTFISGQGSQHGYRDSQILHSIDHEEIRDDWPLPAAGGPPGPSEHLQV